MSIEGLLFALVLIGIVGLWVFAPLLGDKSRQKTDVETQQKQREQLLVLYEQALRNIRDLEDDYATSKINADDYQREREEWTQRGIALLKALDALDTHGIMTPDAPAATPESANVNEAIEAAVAAYRAKKA